MGRVNLLKMIFIPQFLYILHNTPLVVPLKVFRIINSMFRSFIWLNKPLRVKLEQLQRPKEAGGLALPNPWLYYLAAQLQHIARALPLEAANEKGSINPVMALLHHVTGVHNVAMGMEALAYTKSNKLFPTYVLMQKT